MPWYAGHTVVTAFHHTPDVVAMTGNYTSKLRLAVRHHSQRNDHAEVVLKDRYWTFRCAGSKVPPSGDKLRICALLS